jgi:uncharacterized protein (DUF2267 family)
MKTIDAGGDNMDEQEFLKRIAVKTDLRSKEHAEDALKAVFSGLRARIDPHTVTNIGSQLPKGIKDIWEAGIVEHLVRSVTGTKRMDMHEFLDMIMDKLELSDSSEAEQITRVVFMTLQEQITSGAARKIASELPEDIANFWQTSSEGVQIPEEAGRAGGEMTFAPTSEYEEEVPMLGPEYDVPTGADVEHVSPIPPPREGSPAGSYISEEIGPSAAYVYRSDEQLRNEIEQLLGANDAIDASNIHVAVHMGEVTLIGHVKSGAEADTAAHVAKEALGAIEVINDLIVMS